MMIQSLCFILFLLAGGVGAASLFVWVLVTAKKYSDRYEARIHK